MPNSGAIGNTAKLIGETFLPGASELLDGNIKSGIGHSLLGIVGGALLGPVGVLLVKANSFSHSVSEMHLHQHAANLFPKGKAPAVDASAPSS